MGKIKKKKEEGEDYAERIKTPAAYYLWDKRRKKFCWKAGLALGKDSGSLWRSRGECAERI